MFVLKGILRAESQEKVLIYLILRGKGYGKSIAEFFDIPLTPVQKQLARMEEDGVLVSRSIGKVREYELNPRYVFKDNLVELIKNAVDFYPDKIINELMIQRTRPRLAGKPLERASN